MLPQLAFTYLFFGKKLIKFLTPYVKFGTIGFHPKKKPSNIGIYLLGATMSFPFSPAYINDLYYLPTYDIYPLT